MTTARFTIGSLFTTVSATANTATAIVGSVAKSADMLTAFVDKHAAQQTMQYAKEALVFEERLNATLALQLATDAENIAKEKAKSASFASSFDHYFAKLQATGSSAKP